ncbi:branched-chain amino acid ABC transporter permease [Nocardioides sp. 1609]|uniref:branched-chain amino acid ABC transporter permease n=1 Tax=Nocardioides sp. 1609 TaxID=2508327 RepID=UPI00106FC6C5|nr:branched-chain amino acid ABC transporter permease [Nocardioides sp. 1609]
MSAKQITSGPTKPSVVGSRRESTLRQRPAHVLRLLAILAVIVAGFAVPSLVTNPYRLTLLVDGLTLGLLALSLGFLVTQLGLFSFGAGAFFGVTAYGFAFASIEWEWSTTASALFGVGASLAVAAMVGAVFVRVKALPFAMVTLAFSVMMMQFVHQSAFRDKLGGDSGLLAMPQGGFLGVSQEDLLTPDGIWPLVWSVVVVCVAAMFLLGRSRFGRTLRGIRENDERMRYCGFNTYWPKLAAFTISAGLAAVAGLMQILFHGFATPGLFSFGFTGNGIVAALVGGIGSVYGAIIGGVLFTQAQSWLGTSGNLMLYQGAITALVVLFLPRGLAGLISEVSKKALGRIKRGGSDASN